MPCYFKMEYDLEDLSTQFKKLKVEHYNSDDNTRNIVKLRINFEKIDLFVHSL